MNIPTPNISIGPTERGIIPIVKTNIDDITQIDVNDLGLVEKENVNIQYENFLLDRKNHTGYQNVNTIDGFDVEVENVVINELSSYFRDTDTIKFTTKDTDGNNLGHVSADYIGVKTIYAHNHLYVKRFTDNSIEDSNTFIYIQEAYNYAKTLNRSIDFPILIEVSPNDFNNNLDIIMDVPYINFYFHSGTKITTLTIETDNVVVKGFLNIENNGYGSLNITGNNIYFEGNIIDGMLLGQSTSNVKVKANSIGGTSLECDHSVLESDKFGAMTIYGNNLNIISNYIDSLNFQTAANINIKANSIASISQTNSDKIVIESNYINSINESSGTLTIKNAFIAPANGTDIPIIMTGGNLSLIQCRVKTTNYCANVTGNYNLITDNCRMVGAQNFIMTGTTTGNIYDYSTFGNLANTNLVSSLYDNYIMDANLQILE